MKASKRAVLLMEPMIYGDIHSMQGGPNLVGENKGLDEKFQVLLIAYYNLAICLEKVGSTQYA
jgi:hypothetical protein